MTIAHDLGTSGLRRRESLFDRSTMNFFFIIVPQLLLSIWGNKQNMKYIIITCFGIGRRPDSVTLNSSRQKIDVTREGISVVSTRVKTRICRIRSMTIILWVFVTWHNVAFSLKCLFISWPLLFVVAFLREIESQRPWTQWREKKQNSLNSGSQVRFDSKMQRTCKKSKREVSEQRILRSVSPEDDDEMMTSSRRKWKLLTWNWVVLKVKANLSWSAS